MKCFYTTTPVLVGNICHDVSERMQDPQMPFKLWREIKYHVQHHNGAEPISLCFIQSLKYL